MMDKVIAHAARIPARQLHLLLAGVLLVGAALLWTHALRAPLAALRTAQAERVRLESGEPNAALLAAQLKSLDAEVAALNTQLRLDVRQPPAAQALLALSGDISALAAEHRVTLLRADPAASAQALVFDELAVDAEASGRYADLMAWLAAVETARPNAAVVRVDMGSKLDAGAAAEDGRIELKARIALFVPRAEAP